MLIFKAKCLGLVFPVQVPRIKKFKLRDVLHICEISLNLWLAALGVGFSARPHLCLSFQLDVAFLCLFFRESCSRCNWRFSGPKGGGEVRAFLCSHSAGSVSLTRLIHRWWLVFPSGGV